VTLHILFNSEFDTATQCLRAVSDGDALLLLADGVYAALEQSALSTTLGALPATVAVHAIEEDCSARGITSRAHSRVTMADYNAFVALSCSHARSVSWF
jgi:tRNA 2-thiouridine synthesizing protein B